MSHSDDAWLGYLLALTHHLDGAQAEPGLHHLEVRHNDRCPFLRGGECYCVPVIVSGSAIDRKYEPGEP